MLALPEKEKLLNYCNTPVDRRAFKEVRLRARGVVVVTESLRRRNPG